MSRERRGTADTPSLFALRSNLPIIADSAVRRSREPAHNACYFSCLASIKRDNDFSEQSNATA